MMRFIYKFTYATFVLSVVILCSVFQFVVEHVCVYHTSFVKFPSCVQAQMREGTLTQTNQLYVAISVSG